MAATGANTRPIVIRRVKKIVGGHHGGAWKVAYADFVTAMMAFFLLLWLISNPDKQRQKGLAEYFSPSSATSLSQTTDASSSISGVSGMPGAGGHGRRAQSESVQAPKGQPSTKAATAGTSRGGSANIPDASLRVAAQELRVAIDSLPPDDQGRRQMRIEEDRDGLRISLTDTAARSMFKDGTAILNPFAREMLARVAGKLVKSDAQIVIEGHTNGVGNGGDEANWRLSGERALAARIAMIAAGLPVGRFAEMVAMADTRPVYPDQPDRPENRRITIVAKGAAPSLPIDASFRF
ncbi:flagellar motor protein MotB [Sphingomonas mollis]|uniref:OmpA family protein n=1 Tax=Sphingomonas mollis TaxID=2795726 RepID=A0ABS0XQV2_9SPHN|nr:flagellar motor protein MotB [Sphingomonas sp. BT553]MBJ6122118.1 OmpA family protein [Sphingomonas sp. BT553]